MSEGNEKAERRIRKYNIKTLTFLISFIVLLTLGNVTSTAAKTKKISMNYSVIRMTKGYSMKLKVKGTKKKIKWFSSNKKIATVSGKGNVKGKKVGKCNVYAKVNGIKLKCRVRIKKANKVKEVKADFSDITLDLSSLKMDVSNIKFDNEKQLPVLEGNGYFKLKLLNTKASPEWSTSNSEIATVEQGVVTAHSVGTCTIVAKLDVKEYACQVTVTDLKNSKEILKQYNMYRMLSLMNNDRVKSKAAPLKINETLNEVANLRKVEIKKKFSHTRPNGFAYKTILNSFNLNNWKFIGENIAYTRDNSDGIDAFAKYAYDALYKSKGHRENILNPNFEYVGIGCLITDLDVDEDGIASIECYWTQEFYR